MGRVILAGHYEIPRAHGLQVGQYRVRIFQADQVTPPVGPPGSSVASRPQEQIAAKFNSASELVAEVHSLADQRFDYDVQHR